MVDYNFFEGYKKKKVKKSAGVRLFNILFLVLMISLGAYVGFNYYLLGGQEEELKQLDIKIAEASTREDISRINEKKSLLVELESIMSSMDQAAEAIENSSFISEDLLISITDALPSDVNISSLSVSGTNIQLSGGALSKPAIAVFEYNLRSISYFKDIFINSIDSESEEEGSFTYNMTIEVGGGSDENE